MRTNFRLLGGPFLVHALGAELKIRGLDLISRPDSCANLAYLVNVVLGPSLAKVRVIELASIFCAQIATRHLLSKFILHIFLVTKLNRLVTYYN